MSAPDAVERIADRHAALATRLPGGPAWARRRSRSLAAFAARGLPGRRDENWKYLDHARVAEQLLEPAAPSAAAAALDARLLAIDGARRIVLVDGRYDAQRSEVAGVEGLEVRDLSEFISREPEAALAAIRAPGEDADDRYALLADAFAADGVLIRVAAGARLPGPLYLVHAASAIAAASHHARVAIQVGSAAQLTLVEHFLAAGDARALSNLAAELTAGDGADVTHVRLHESGVDAALVETWVTRLGAGCRYDQHFLALGGRLLRSNLELSLEGRGAACRLSGLFLADGDRQVDLLARVDHRGPATGTRQDVRGIASGRGRGAFNGRIVVHETARGADASQSSRNLLLSPLAEINARPQLEIRVDDVQCRHGATTGSLDESQLFYLRSRGLDEHSARALLTFAFCQDVVGRVPVPAVRAAAEKIVAGSLPDRELIRGLV
jgi:Fe-S cluster assembly protein SufD